MRGPGYRLGWFTACNLRVQSISGGEQGRLLWLCGQRFQLAAHSAGELLHLGVLARRHHLPIAHSADVVDRDVLKQLPGLAGLCLRIGSPGRTEAGANQPCEDNPLLPNLNF